MLMNKSASLRISIGVLIVVLLVAVPALAAASVTRSPPATAMAGDTVGVTLAVTLDGATYYAIDEIVPDGWIVTGASSGGDYSAQVGHVKWVCVEGCSDITYSYNSTVPSGISGLYNFSGTWAMEGVPETPVGGGDTTNVSLPPVPDFSVSVAPGVRNIRQGMWNTTTVTVQSINDYSDSTALTASLPSALLGKVTVSFSRSSIVPPPNGTNTSVANISVSASAPVGSYTINITATRGSIVRKAGLALTISAPAACGNNVTESGEDCDGTDLAGKTCKKLGYTSGTLSCTDECEFDTTECVGGGGGGGGGGTSGWSSAVVRTDVVPDCANFSVSNLPAGYFVQWMHPNTTLLKLTRIELTPKINLPDALVRVCKVSLPGSVSALSNVYQYYLFNATVDGESMTDSNITLLKIEFAVENSWLSANNIVKTSMSLYRWTGSSWSKLNTTKFSEDSTYTRYEAIAPGFSYFGVAGEKQVCPACQVAGDWSSCIAGPDGKGRQNRTEYECSAATNFTCAPKTVSQDCCPTCTAAGAWSACTNAQQTRTAYRCSDATGYKCEQFTDTQPCVDAPTASAAIAAARSAITNAKSAGKNVTAAESLLSQAETAFNLGNYESARNLASQAQSSAAAAPQLPAPPLLEILLSLIAIFGAGGGGAYYLKRRRAAPPVTHTCVVCGQPTTLHVKCSSCGQFACVRHMQTIGGKPYCTNCVRKMYRQG